MQRLPRPSVPASTEQTWNPPGSRSGRPHDSFRGPNDAVVFSTFTYYLGYTTHPDTSEHPYQYDKTLDTIKRGPPTQPRLHGDDSVYVLQLHQNVNPTSFIAGDFELGGHGTHAVNTMDDLPLSSIERVDFPTTDGLKHEDQLTVVAHNKAQVAKLHHDYKDNPNVFLISTNALAYCSEFLGLAPHPNATYLNMAHDGNTKQRIGQGIYSALSRIHTLTIKAFDIGCTKRDVFEQLNTQSTLYIQSQSQSQAHMNAASTSLESSDTQHTAQHGNHTLSDAYADQASNPFTHPMTNDIANVHGDSGYDPDPGADSNVSE